MMTTQTLTKRNVAAIGEEISQKLGAQFIKNHKEAYPTQSRAYVIGKEIINQILAQPGCVGIKIYDAINEFGQKNLVYVGLDAEGKVMVNYQSINQQGEIKMERGIVGDRNQPQDVEDWWWMD